MHFLRRQRSCRRQQKRLANRRRKLRGSLKTRNRRLTPTLFLRRQKSLRRQLRQLKITTPPKWYVATSELPSSHRSNLNASSIRTVQLPRQTRTAQKPLRLATGLSRKLSSMIQSATSTSRPRTAKSCSRR